MQGLFISTLSKKRKKSSEWETLLWRYNGHDGVSNHQPHDCLLNLLFRRRSKKTSKLRVTGLCEGNSPVTGEFPAQRASKTENVSIWWRHHGEWLQVLNSYNLHIVQTPCCIYAGLLSQSSVTSRSWWVRLPWNHCPDGWRSNPSSQQGKMES